MVEFSTQLLRAAPLRQHQSKCLLQNTRPRARFEVAFETERLGFGIERDVRFSFQGWYLAA